MKSKDPSALSVPPGSISTGSICADTVGSGASPGRLLLAVLLLALLGAGCFANSLKNPFLNWDDQVYIQDNPSIRKCSWSNLKAVFTQPYFKNYAPIHLLSYQLDYHLFKLRPEGYRMVNILLHLLNSILILFLILEWYHSFEAALIGAAIFAVHTIHVESVVWLSQRKDVLSAFFFLLSLYAYSQFRKRKERCCGRGTGFWMLDAGCWSMDARGGGRGVGCRVRDTDPFLRQGDWEARGLGDVSPSPLPRVPQSSFPFPFHWPLATNHWYGLSLALFLLALLTKPIAVTLPLVLVLAEFCFQKDGSLIRWKDKIPFFLLAALSASVTYWAQSVGTGIKRYVGHSLFLSLLLTGKILVLYLGKLLVPLGLSARYVFPVKNLFELFTPSLILSWVLLVLFLGWMVCLWLRKKKLSFPGLWFLITILPVANLVPTSTQMADRYLYLPSLGYGLAVGLLVSAFSQWAKHREHGNLLRAAAIFLTAGLVMFYGSLTWARNRAWRSDRSLWEDALATDHNNYHAATALANTYLVEAKNARNPRQKESSLKMARELLQNGIRIKPDFVLAHLGMGSVLIEEGKAKEAIPFLLRASRQNDEEKYSPLIEHNLGIAYLRAGQTKAAQKAFACAIRQDSRFAPAYISLGTIYFDYSTPQGYRMAEEQYLRALEVSPEDPMGSFYLAIARERLGNFRAAIDNYQQALRLVEEEVSPSVNPADIHLNLAGLYYRLQDYARAVEHYRQVLRLDPNHVQAEAVRSMLRSLGANP